MEQLFIAVISKGGIRWNTVWMCEILFSQIQYKMNVLEMVSINYNQDCHCKPFCEKEVLRIKFCEPGIKSSKWLWSIRLISSKNWTSCKMEIINREVLAAKRSTYFTYIYLSAYGFVLFLLCGCIGKETWKPVGSLTCLVIHPAHALFYHIIL